MNMFGLSVTQTPMVTKKLRLLALSACEVRSYTFYLARPGTVLVFVSVTTDGFWKQLNKHTQKCWERVTRACALLIFLIFPQ